MKVTLLSYTPDPEMTVAIAARRCYSAPDSSRLTERLSSEEAKKLINMILEAGHLSPTEHALLLLLLKG